MKVFKHHEHIDNGGPTLTVYVPENRKDIDEHYGCLEISDGYYGYSSTIWKFGYPTAKMLRNWADILLAAARAMEDRTPEQLEK